MKDALAVLKLLWWSWRYGKNRWTLKRMAALLACAWKIYRTRRQIAKLHQLLTAPKFFR